MSRMHPTRQQSQGNPQGQSRKLTHGKKPTGFDFTAAMRRLCVDLVDRLPVLSHIEMSRVAVVFAQARKRVTYGVQASLTPLRFEGGLRTGMRQGKPYQVQRVLDEQGTEMLYILRFYLPRFLDLPFHEKMVTVLHELWHINPEFNGDLRRYDGRCYAHTSSQREYDARMAVFAKDWLRREPPEELYAFLQSDFDGLLQHHGKIYGTRMPQPKLIAAGQSAS